MTSHFAHRAGGVLGLPVAGFFLLGGLVGCGSGGTTDPDGVEPVSQDLQFVHWCGGFLQGGCQPQEVCLPFVAGGCPGPQRIGLCAPRPPVCPPFSAPVCGCDGVTYTNFCEAAKAGAAVDHQGGCAASGQPVCGSAAGMACAGAGTCVDDTSDQCTPSQGRNCPGVCQCNSNPPCARTAHFDHDPRVCACVPDGPDPCARVVCPGGTMCIAQPDGTTTCDPMP